MGCGELFRGVHTEQIQTQTQIPIVFCANLLVSVLVSVSVSVSVSGSVNTPRVLSKHEKSRLVL